MQLATEAVGGRANAGIADCLARIPGAQAIKVGVRG